MNLRISRRAIFRTGALASLTTLAGAVLPTATAEARERRRDKYRDTSVNEWPIQTSTDGAAQVRTRTVAGTGLSVPVSIGDVEAILLHVVRRFHYEIEQILSIDLTGWQPIDEISRELPESNLASGTAIRIRPGSRAKGGFFPLQELVLRDILTDCEGVVRWGGDDNPVDESLFYIALSPRNSRVRTLADRFRGDEVTVGKGAGITVDFLNSSRRNRAQSLARSQRKH